MKTSITMSSDHQQDSDTLRNDSEDFRTVPQDSETFSNVPKPSEAFRTVPNDAEARESHTLTVKEVARMFENAGVARTERSVVNWCQTDATGNSRLDSYFDPNERKHFITPESVERAIQEERARAGGGAGWPSRKQSETSQIGEEDAADMKELRQQVMDLTITNKGKDYIIQQLEKDRERLFEKHELLVDRVADSSRLVGQLEEKLHRLDGPGDSIRSD